MPIYFQHVEGSKKGQLESFDSDRVRVGREAGTDLKFDPHKDREVSGNHAEIYRQRDLFFIKDLQSRNGTYVNSHRVSQPTPLKDGDIIEFSSRGPKVIFSTKEPAVGTLVVKEEEILRPGVGTKTVAMMIGDALSEARSAQRGRFGSTTVFMREFLKQASTHSSRRLRIAVICLVILLAEFTGGLVYVNYQKRKEREGLAQQQERLIKEQEQQRTKIAEQETKISEMKALVEELKKKGLEVRETPRGVTVNLPNILFEFDRAELTPDGEERVGYIASALKNHARAKKITIEGHASVEKEGQEEYNQLLSDRRARNVTDAVLSYGIGQNVSTKGLGSTRPVASNESEEGRRLNRRVEVVIEN